MKKKLPEAKLPLPKFKSAEEEADYFGTHSVAGIWEKLPDVKPMRLSKKLEESIRQRHASKKSPISIRLDAAQIAAAKRIATAKSVGYQTQLRMWIAEGIQREARRR